MPKASPAPHGDFIENSENDLQSDSLSNMPTIHMPECTDTFCPFFEDELCVQPGTQIAILNIEKSRNMIKVKTAEREGWIPRSHIDTDDIKIAC